MYLIVALVILTLRWWNIQRLVRHISSVAYWWRLIIIWTHTPLVRRWLCRRSSGEALSYSDRDPGFYPWLYRLVGLVVRRLPRKRKIPGSKIGTPVATLPGAWHYRISAGTGRPSVSILWLGEVESWICNFYLSVAACKIVWADPSLRYTRMLLGR